MGCSSSSPEPAPKPAPAPTATPVPQPTKASKGKKERKFQIKLGGEWKDYDPQEDAVLKRAFMVGQPNVRFELRGQKYEYNFKTMKQKNLGTNKERQIRPPYGFKAPRKARLPPGPMIVITVPKGAAGKCIEIDDPNNKGKKMKVNVPKGAKTGQKMAVPVPAAGESVEVVREKQKGHSKAAKLAMGTAGVAAVGVVAVGGVILGDHLSDGAVADWAGEHLGEGAGDAVEAATDWTVETAGDIGEWFEAVAEDYGDFVEGAAEDAAAAHEALADGLDDAGDWLGDAFEDGGDFLMDLF